MESQGPDVRLKSVAIRDIKCYFPILSSLGAVKESEGSGEAGDQTSARVSKTYMTRMRYHSTCLSKPGYKVA